ncbi:pantoate--beta-alanine ligase [Paralimibaculum aggregatum]|uniref:Pantothenate synthetase n=1 Tax=Paralimibaculum aggregatum TaxID=3036245 RepID=A0ABQ6LFW5_9RHOB|nr:pantoate--beta-alanine ligase [Limibaculum sp. NKW23]GMG82218.1 pantoate--beta-alanine ligase [Limibaculum sp. NKW23]
MAGAMAGAIETVRRVGDLRARVRGWKAEGLRVGLTPTMGALHEGHLSLVARALEATDRVVATIFVNPTQFGAGEDFSTYPRDEARDGALLARAGASLLFAPPVEEMYPPGFATEVRVSGLTDCLCGAARPGHFDGVAQVVTKLLNQAEADAAVFGEKDWQQLAVIRRLARDLDIPTEILGAPILREADGLAMSSRNRYLTAEERAVAPALARALTAAAAEIAGGRAPAEACADAAAALQAAGFRAVDYVDCREADSLAPVQSAPPARPARIFGAAHLGRARLIDNLPVPGAGR